MYLFCLLFTCLCSILVRTNSLFYYQKYIAQIDNNVLFIIIIFSVLYALYLVVCLVFMTYRAYVLHTSNFFNRRAINRDAALRGISKYYYTYFLFVAIITYKINALTYSYFISLPDLFPNFNIESILGLTQINLQYLFIFLLILALLVGIWLVYMKGTDGKFDFNKGNNALLKLGLFWFFIANLINFINLYFEIFNSVYTTLFNGNRSLNSFLYQPLTASSENYFSSTANIKDYSLFMDHNPTAGSSSAEEAEPSRGRTRVRGMKRLSLDRDQTVTRNLAQTLWYNLRNAPNSSTLYKLTHWCFHFELINTTTYDPEMQGYVLPPIYVGQPVLDCGRTPCFYCSEFNNVARSAANGTQFTADDRFYTSRPIQPGHYTVQDTHPVDVFRR